MAKRETSAGRTKRPRREQTAAEKSAGAANLAKGRAARERARLEAEERAAVTGETRMTATERWRKLLDGSLTVKDLDDEEITAMRVKDKHGVIQRGRSMPSHLVQAFHQEAIRRATDKIRTAAPEAVQALLDIGRDPEVKESDRLKALMYVIDRGLGKTPDVVRVEGMSEFDTLMGRAAGLDRDLADDA